MNMNNSTVSKNYVGECVSAYMTWTCSHYVNDILIPSPTGNSPHCNDFSWTRPHGTRYMQILNVLASGPLSKREIIKKVWGFGEENFYTEAFSAPAMTIKGINPSGYHSKTFACMNADNLINYNTKTRKWEIAENGVIMLKTYHS